MTTSKEKQLEASSNGSTQQQNPVERYKAIDHELGIKIDPKDQARRESLVEAVTHGITTSHPTSYGETMMHLFKGNIGTGMFALGDAFKNAGVITAPILTFALAVVSVHCQHVLLTCSRKMQEANKINFLPDFAETVELCFQNGPPKLRSWAPWMKTVVNIFICVTQLGFCCIYFVFISTNLKQVLDYYDLNIDVQIVMVIAFLPILLPSLITNLKYLAPISALANVFLAIGVVITMYYAFKDGLPSPSERAYYTPWNQLALFFGTAIFAFEGIALVLPLKNAMREPNKFDRPLGVLNVGMSFVVTLFIFVGFFGYLKWGENVCGSLTLNLDVDDWLARLVKIAVSLGVLFGYPLQFFVAIQITWPSVSKAIRGHKHPVLKQMIFRTVMVLLTFAIAELVPKLNLFISMIGAVCSTALALVFPPVIEMILSWGNISKGPNGWMLLKNTCILLVALLGFSTGGFESISSLVNELVFDTASNSTCEAAS
ncbi:unnamed protein product [Hermetia illucens]|uniref:Amino acid transporter transmembrane domain-containing protein n=1 Tax=Hermetia illucens TaxID=343691 RepID=A0A7R8V174_HERIL|nr:proton-coupled amino acid transporter 1 [Hermetia illucens]XP_037918920.1 proton-coupled amino acid transporter 1 [Hermetia illucens]XP_037918921.1 proton-coupled amino acid transporter 1 [Hermetia illucens]CAD7090733.1 unnamed protein product [Hermetia illucens]